MFATICVIVLCAVAIVVVQAEVYALFKGIQFGLKCKYNTVSERFTIAFIRYGWGSILWHEAACGRLGKKPAYRISIPAVAVWAIGVVHRGAEFQETPFAFSMATALGAATIVGIGFFAAAYGKAFVAARSELSTHQQAGTGYVY
jgi:hypothetical protein